MKYYYLNSLLVSFLIVITMMPVIRWLAIRVGFLDLPSARKVHANPIPLGGGLAVFISFILIIIAMTFIFDFNDARPAIGIIVGATLIVIMGLCDDHYDMGFQAKLLGQVVAAVLFLAFVKNVSPIISFPAYPILAVLWIVSLQNAFNFLDNMDGLCAGISMMIAVGFGILFAIKGMPVFAVMSFALAGAAIGFLRYNLPPANIFLGDTGSLLFGFCLSCLGIVHLNSSGNLIEALAPLLIIVYPMFDLSFVIITRLNEGRKVYIGGKDHSSHKISFMGLTKKATVFTIYLINILLVSSGVAIFFMEDSPFGAIIVVVFAFALAFIGVHIYKNILYVKDKIISFLTDLTAVNLAFLLYYFLKYKSGFLEFTSFLPLDILLVPLVWINIYWILLYAVMGLYDIPFELNFRYHGFAVVRTLLVGIVIFLLINFRFGEGFLISSSSVLVYIALLLILNMISRYFLSGYLKRKLKNGKKKVNSVLVKLNPSGEIHSSLKPFAENYNIVGYVGDEGFSGLKRLGGLDDLHDVLKENKVARVILGISDKNYNNLKDIFGSAFYLETEFLIVDNKSDSLNGLKKSKTFMENISLITIRYQKFFVRAAKRGIDITFAVLILLISSPIFIYQYIKSKIKKSPFLVRVSFYGRDGKVKNCLDFYNHALRYSSRDFVQPGLPSLVSVIGGSLSLVGTMPLSLEKADRDSKDVQGFWRRKLIKPGIFGKPHLSEKGEYFENELKYMERISIIFDIYLLITGIMHTLVSLSGKRENAGSETY